MEAIIFKTIDHKPKEIKAVAQSYEYFAALHCDSFSIFSIQNFQKLLHFDILYNCTIAKFLNARIIVLVSENKIIFFDIHKSEIKIIEHEFPIKFMEICSDIIFVNSENQIIKLELDKKALKNDCNIEIYNNDNFEVKMVDYLCSKVIQYEKNSITAIALSENEITYTNDNGYIKFYKDSVLTEHFYNDKIVNKIAIHGHNVLSMITNDGSLIVYDKKNAIITDEVKIRNSPLYSLGILNNNIFCAGEDNRLINYELADGKLLRKNQTDTHNAAVFDIVINNNRIITVSKDCSIGVHEVRDQGFCFRKILLDANVLKTSSNKFLTLNEKTIKIYKIEDKLHKKSAHFYDEHEFTCLFEFQMNQNILCFDISRDGSLLSYATDKKTIIIRIEDTKYEKLASYEPAYQTSFFDKFFCYVNMQKKLKIVDLSTKAEVFSLFLNDYDDRIQIGCNCIILTKSKLVINEKMEVSKMDVDDYIERVAFGNDKLYLLVHNQEYSVNTNYAIIEYDLPTKKATRLASIRGVCKLINFICYDNKIICNDSDYLFVTDIKTQATKKKNFGSIILDIAVLSDTLFVYQIEKAELYRNCDDNKHLKIKWSKKLANK